MNLGRVGLWSGELRFLRDRGAAHAAAAEVEELGFETIWVPGGTGSGRPMFDVVDGLLDATERVVVACGVLSIWVQDAVATARGQEALRARHPGRFLLGLGVSHPQLVDHELHARLARPRSEMAAYLDQLDAAATDGLCAERVIAALRPRMLELARDRSAGAHPYLVTPDHTAEARVTLGADTLLAPEQGVVLETDPARAREIARAHLSVYLGLPNYTGNMLRYGFTEDDLLDGGSDRLVDGIVAWGDEEAILARVREHEQAGADHVALQVLSGRRGEVPLPEWRRLSDALR